MYCVYILGVLTLMTSSSLLVLEGILLMCFPICGAECEKPGGGFICEGCLLKRASASQSAPVS